MRSHGRPWGLGVLAVLVSSCAGVEPPSGGEPDRTPPQVIATEPAAMSVVPEWDDPVVIRFNERISQRGIDQAVMVSPETGEVRVDKGRSDLRVRVHGGWRPGEIYHVVVLPVVQDLFNNARQEAVDLVFSTGPPIANTAVAGLVQDRETGEPVGEARVEAVRRADSVVYVTLTDTAGFYALRHIPEGAYDLRVYVDAVRNRKRDFAERADTGSAVLGVNDTSIVSFSLLPGDTTAARLTRAEAPDSLQIRLYLDDLLDPEEPLDAVVAELLRLPDSVAVAVDTILYADVFDHLRSERLAALQDSLAAAADTSAAADKAAAAPVRPRVAADSAGVPVPSTPADEADTAAVRLPLRELVVVPAEPLPPETDFVIVVRGIRNIHGLVGGGGSAEFRTPERVDPPSSGEPADTIPATPPDTSRSR